MSLILFKDLESLSKYKEQIDHMSKGIFEREAFYFFYGKRLNALKLYSFDHTTPQLVSSIIDDAKLAMKKAFGDK